MPRIEEIRHLLSSWGELRPQPASNWQGAAEQLPAEVARFYEQIGPWGDVIYESVGPVGLSLSAGGNPICIPPLHKLLNLQAGYAWESSPDQPFADWPSHWLVIAEQGGDPFIHDNRTGQIFFAFHGAGRWDPQLFAPDLYTALGGIATVADIHESLSEEELNLDDGLTPQGRARVLAALSQFTHDPNLAQAMLDAWEYYE